MTNSKKIIYSIITFIILINVISYYLNLRIDCTTNKNYSLSDVSEKIIQEINEPISIDYYVSKELPPDMKKISEEFLLLVKEYKNLSHCNFSIKIIHPDNNLTGNEAIKAGIRPIFIEVKEHDFEKIHNIFIGAVIRIGDKHTVIPSISRNTPMEYEITRILHHAIDTIKPSIAFITGHHENSLAQMPILINELSRQNDISVINLAQTKNLAQYNAICIIAPKDLYTYHEKEQLNNYLAQGGRLFVALNYAVGQINGNRSNGYINETGIENILEEKGLKIQPDFVIDNNCGTVSLNLDNGGYLNYQTRVSFPFVPMITNFSNHPITRGLNTIFLPFASSLKQIKTRSTYIFTPLAMTSSISGTILAPIFINLQKTWNRSDFNSPHNIVAALLTNEDTHSAIITISDADFLINDVNVYAHLLHSDNINFAINSIEWLSDNTGLIQLRNKFAAFLPLEPINENEKLTLKYINFLFPLLTILIFAIIKMRRKYIKRLRRSQPGYFD